MARPAEAQALSRRGLIAAGLSLAAASPGVAAAKPDGLGALAKGRGLFYGAAVGSAVLERDPAFARAVAEECGMIVPEGDAKWDIVQPSPGRFDPAPLDRLLAFASRNGMGFRGHCLVWHGALPGWMQDALRGAGASAVRELLENHVAYLMGRTRGRAHSWDVVNEAIEIGEGADPMRRTPWLAALGPGYVDLAFHAARRADPKTKLVYNDYATDAADEPSAKKRAAVLDLLRGMKARGVPVDALGIQAHLSARDPLESGVLRDYVRAAAALGLEVYVTELDVWEAGRPGTTAEREAAVAAYADRFLEPVLAEPAVKGVTTWGLSDRYTWLNSNYAAWAKRTDGTPNHCLPLDGQLRRTPFRETLARRLGAR